MPRARSQASLILHRLNDVRHNIRTLLQSLQQVDNHRLFARRSITCCFRYSLKKRHL